MTPATSTNAGVVPSCLLRAVAVRVGTGTPSGGSSSAVFLPKFQTLGSSVVAYERMPTPVREIHHPAASELDLAHILRTVGDSVRLAIVRLLADDRERTCTAIQ